MEQISGISEEWLKSFSSPVSALLEQLEQSSMEKFPRAAHMLSGFSQGRLLALFSSLLRPERILEIGTFTGYGSLCLAEGLSESGLLFTLENSTEHAALARHFFEYSDYKGRIRLIEGNAADILPELNETWDLVYLDADKTSNRLYLNLIWKHLRPEGVVLVDNVFARGGIFKKQEEQRSFEKAVTALNQDLPGLFADGELFILPIRDGLSILRKKA